MRPREDWERDYRTTAEDGMNILRHSVLQDAYEAHPEWIAIVYLPWEIDRTYWEVMCVDHGTLLHNAVWWAAKRLTKHGFYS